MRARFDRYELDTNRRELVRDGSYVHLTPKAFDLLSLLIAESGRVVKKAEVHARLWEGIFVSDATIVSLVKEIRRALNDRDPRTPIIRTVHGVGYVLAVSVERSSPAMGKVSHWVVVRSRRVRLENGETLIGRDPASTVHLDVVGVSRCHARIIVDDTAAFLEDLGSKNGTAVGDETVTGRHLLRDGDQLHIGPAVIIYHASIRGATTETVDRQVTRSRKRTR